MPERTMRVGTLLYGFCGGYFGRDSYADKRIEGIGADWVVVRNLNTGLPQFAAVSPDELMLWSEPPE